MLKISFILSTSGFIANTTVFFNKIFRFLFMKAGNLFCFMYLSKDFVETSNNSQASTLVMSADWGSQVESENNIGICPKNKV